MNEEYRVEYLYIIIFINLIFKLISLITKSLEIRLLTGD